MSIMALLTAAAAAQRQKITYNSLAITSVDFQDSDAHAMAQIRSTGELYRKVAGLLVYLRDWIDPISAAGDDTYYFQFTDTGTHTPTTEGHVLGAWTGLTSVHWVALDVSSRISRSAAGVLSLSLSPSGTPVVASGAYTLTVDGTP